MHNTVSLIGNLGADPEVRYLPDGKPVANLRLAVSDFYKDRNGVRQQKTYWFTCVAWNKNAEILSEYTRKGSKIAITGRLTTREWQDQTGAKRVNTEIIINDLELLSRIHNDEEAAHSQTQRPQAGRTASSASPPPPPPSSSVSDTSYAPDDDIPF